jgi:hypothetical protein
VRAGVRARVGVGGVRGAGELVTHHLRGGLLRVGLTVTIKDNVISICSWFGSWSRDSERAQRKHTERRCQRYR